MDKEKVQDEKIERENTFLRWVRGKEPIFRALGQWLLRLLWVFPPIVVLSAMFLFYQKNGLYPYGDKTISWCDMDQQVIPLLMDFKDVLSGKEGFLFSFKNAGGMNFYGVFFFFLASPFTFLIVFVDKVDIALFVNLLVMLKMCAMAGTASYYFSKKYPKAWGLNIALSTLYAYSGYTMMYYQNMIWLDVAYLFPLLLLGLEKLKQGKRALFICVLSACIVVNYYLGYMIVVFLLLYAFVWTVLSKDKKFTGDFVLCCVVSALISAVVWLPSLAQYFDSGRQSSIVENLRNSGMLTPYQTALPTVFSILFLFPFALGARADTDKDVRLRFIVFLGLLLPLFIEPIAKMWQTGSYMSFPTRYAFMTIFLCMTLTMDTLSKRANREKQFEENQDGFWKGIAKRIPMYALNIGILLLTVWYFRFSRRFTDENVSVMNRYARTLWGDDASFEKLCTMYIVALIVGVLVFVLYRLRLLKTVTLWLCVGLLVFSELYVAPQIYMLTPAHSVEWLQDATEIADSIDDEGFYRVKSNKEYSGHDFDANLMGGLGYNALGHYTSLTSERYMTTIKRFGYTSYWMEVGNSGGTLLTDALLSVKYSISTSKSSQDVVQGEYYHIAPTVAYLPLGVLTSTDVIAKQTPFTNRADLQKTLYKDFFGNENGVTVYGLNDATLTNLTVKDGENGKKILTPDKGKTGQIKFQVSVTENETFYFNVFDENTNALKQSINEKFTISSPKCNQSKFPAQKQNGLLCLGEYAKENFDITIKLNAEVSVSELGLVGIKNERLSKDVASAKTIALSVEKGKVEGTYTAEGGECVFLSIPYDEGLRLKINGKRADLHEVYGGFTAFYLEEGENEIVVTFAPQGFVLGMVLSVIGLGLCAVAITLWVRRKKRIDTTPILETVGYYGILAIGVAVVLVIYLFPVLLSTL